MDAMTPRQQRALLAYARPGATLTTVGAELGYSKSTVETEVKAALSRIRECADTLEEATAIHAAILDMLDTDDGTPVSGRA
jgi:DNA-directed RNA polymerase specialized sigma24 family protein